MGGAWVKDLGWFGSATVNAKSISVRLMDVMGRAARILTAGMAQLPFKQAILSGVQALSVIPVMQSAMEDAWLIPGCDQINSTAIVMKSIFASPWRVIAALARQI